MFAMVKRISNWFRFIFKGQILLVKLWRGHRELVEDYKALAQRVRSIEAAFGETPVSEKSFAEFQDHTNKALAAIEERLDSGRRRAPSGRPFHLLKTIAEQGEAVARVKNAGS